MGLLLVHRCAYTGELRPRSDNQVAVGLFANFVFKCSLWIRSLSLKDLDNIQSFSHIVLPRLPSEITMGDQLLQKARRCSRLVFYSPTNFDTHLTTHIS